MRGFTVQPKLIPPPFSYSRPLESLAKDSPEFAWRTIERLKVYFVQKETTAEAFAAIMAEAEEHQVWNHWPADRPYGSKEEMARQALRARWEEVEHDLLERRTKERVRAAAQETDGRVQTRGGDRKSAVSMSKFDIDTQGQRARVSGLSRYQQNKLDRLARDYPDLLESVRDGTMSAHAACIQAGISEPTITVPLDPEKMARAIRRRLSDDELEVLLEALEAAS